MNKDKDVNQTYLEMIRLKDKLNEIQSLEFVEKKNVLDKKKGKKKDDIQGR